MLDRLAVLVPVLRTRVGAIAVQAVERRQRLETPALVFGQRGIGRAHARHAGAAAGRRDLHAVQDGRGRRTLAVGVVGVPPFGRALAVAVPDQPDHREVRHVVLRVVLLHRRPEQPTPRRDTAPASGTGRETPAPDARPARAHSASRVGSSMGWLRSTPATSAPSDGCSGMICSRAMASLVVSGPGRDFLPARRRSSSSARRPCSSPSGRSCR